MQGGATTLPPQGGGVGSGNGLGIGATFPEHGEGSGMGVRGATISPLQGAAVALWAMANTVASPG